MKNTFCMKRKIICSNPTPQVLNGDEISVRSCNYPDYYWGYRDGDRSLSIVKQKIRRAKFRISCNITGLKSVSLSLLTASGTTFVCFDEDSSEVTLGVSRSTFSIEILDSFGQSSFIGRFVTKSGEYLRHSNYVLRVDPRVAYDYNLEEDSRWIITVTSTTTGSVVSTARGTPSSIQSGLYAPELRRPIFIHIENCEGAFSKMGSNTGCCLNVLIQYFETQLTLATTNRRSSRVETVMEGEQSVKSYLLQGAGGMSMDAKAMAISTFPPDGSVPDYLIPRIEEATTVKSRGGVLSFLKLPDDIGCLILRLARFAKSHMKRKRMFGMVPKSRFDLELGFCEWITLPHGSEIIPHRDGGNDCDVAAIFAIYNSAVVNVEGTEVQLDPGQMYIFEPQKFTHSVSKPLLEGPRHVVALRFFRHIISEQ